jgi:hypothetical protein
VLGNFFYKLDTRLKILEKSIIAGFVQNLKSNLTRILVTSYVLLLIGGPLFSQTFNDFERGNTEARFVFYNTENLFDVIKDSIKRDEDFTPDGAKHWDKWKYNEKQNNLSKVIVSVGGWNLPELVAFCEIENKKVLYDLTNYTSLKNKGYEIVHFESPDRRGIDVGFIYLKEKIQVLNAEPVSINFPWDSTYKTRDILHAKLLLFGTDTLHFFVCHWPSKWGGHLETDKSRLFVGNVLTKYVFDFFDSHYVLMNCIKMQLIA